MFSFFYCIIYTPQVHYSGEVIDKDPLALEVQHQIAQNDFKLKKGLPIKDTRRYQEQHQFAHEVCLSFFFHSVLLIFFILSLSFSYTCIFPLFSRFFSYFPLHILKTCVIFYPHIYFPFFISTLSFSLPLLVFSLYIICIHISSGLRETSKSSAQLSQLYRHTTHIISTP